MALLFMDGFDKYGPVNTNGTNVAGMLTAGEWNADTQSTIVAGLSAPGYALALTGGGTCSKTLPANYGRLIGGMRFSSNLIATSGIQFIDAAANQCGICINTAGTIAVRNAGYNSGTILGTSSASVTANTTHYLEWDITFGNSANYQLWLDGVSILTGTGDTTGTANNTANSFYVSGAGTCILSVDDLYVFDTTGSTNNAVLLTSPRIETTFPVTDSSVQFGIGAAILGTSVARTTGTTSTAANQFRVRPFTPARNCTVNSISFLPSATSATVNLRPVVYADSSNAPGSLMSAGSTVTAMTSATVVTMPLTTPQALTAGTQYWLGYMCDIAVTNGLTLFDAAASERTATSTFASGAPGTAPATSAGATTVLWGNVTSTGANYFELLNPAQGTYSNLTDSTVNHEDLYAFPALVTNPTVIYAVGLKANCSRSDSGARTVSMRMLSSGTDSGGTVTGQTPGTSYGWLTTLFETDPHTAAAWLPANVNAATSGFRIDA